MSRSCWRAFALTLALASPVAAQEGDEIARRTLIEQAEQARSAGDHPRALDLAQRAGAIRMTPSVRQIIAYEHEAVGHTLEALDAAQGCEREARLDASLRNRDRILEACASLSTTLRSRVAWVTVRVPRPTPPGLRVTVGGRELRPALWGVAWPALPGALVIDATSEDGRFHRVVSADAGSPVEVVVDPSPGADHVPPRGPGAGPWILAGAGALTLGAAAAFAALRVGARDARDEADAADHMEAAISHNERFETFTVLTDVALGVGASALAGGALWYLLARGGATPPVSVAIHPGGHGVTVGVGGTL